MAKHQSGGKWRINSSISENSGAYQHRMAWRININRISNAQAMAQQHKCGGMAAYGMAAA